MERKHTDVFYNLSAFLSINHDHEWQSRILALWSCLYLFRMFASGSQKSLGVTEYSAFFADKEISYPVIVSVLLQIW